MNWLLKSPTIDDLIRLLKAWRFWALGGFLGALIGAAVFYTAPPPHRATATVVVDFNLEQAWPAETDRQQFYYLERETRKLQEIAWSDAVLAAVANADGNVTMGELRGGILSLSQPADGGWHFHAADPDAERAAALVSAWARAFADEVRLQASTAVGLNSFIQADVTQSAQPHPQRSASVGDYLLVGAMAFLAIASLYVLFSGRSAW